MGAPSVQPQGRGPVISGRRHTGVVPLLGARRGSSRWPRGRCPWVVKFWFKSGSTSPGRRPSAWAQEAWPGRSAPSREVPCDVSGVSSRSPCSRRRGSGCREAGPADAPAESHADGGSAGSLHGAWHCTLPSPPHRPVCPGGAPSSLKPPRVPPHWPLATSPFLLGQESPSPGTAATWPWPRGGTARTTSASSSAATGSCCG